MRMKFNSNNVIQLIIAFNKLYRNISNAYQFLSDPTRFYSIESFELEISNPQLDWSRSSSKMSKLNINQYPELPVE